jgi:outer membrane immunogenic protein
VKKIVLCVSVLLAFGAAIARADELPTRPPYIGGYTSPSVIQQIWTGFYVGVNGGYNFSSEAVYYPPNDPASTLALSASGIPSAAYHVNGALGGGQIGYNYQMMNWLVGIEADYQWSNLSGTGTARFRLPTTSSGNLLANASMAVNESMDSFGTVRARLGLVAATPLLLYGTGGFAYGQIKENISGALSGSGTLSKSGFSYVCTTSAACFAGSASRTAFGWTLGFGGEYLITNNIAFRAEYLYVNLPAPKATVVAQNAATGSLPASFTANFGTQGFNLVRAGLNYKF